MKRKITLLCMLTVVAFSYAQESFSGFRSGNYNGVYGLLSNPANIAVNARKWDVNLFSVNLDIANNKASLNLGNIGNVTNMGKLGEDILNGGGTISAILNTEILGPSFMYNINEKHSVAFTSRARIIVSIYDFDINLLKTILDEKDIKNVRFPYTINSDKDQKVTANGWSEYGLSWGGTVYEDDNHTIKAGATLKYLSGFSNSYANIDNIHGEINGETTSTTSSYKRPYLTDTRGKLALVNSGANFFGGNFKAGDITESFGTGFGADLGVVYEYRDENTADWVSTGYAKSYTFKVGLSLMDLGSIKYTPIKDRGYDYQLHISAVDRLYLDDLGDKPIETLNNPRYATGRAITESYTAALPTALRLIGDYHVYNHFFVALDTQFSVVGNKAQNPYVTNNFTVTPRYETRILGAYLPIGYNGLSGSNVGVAFRAGPVFLGSGSILSSLAGGKQIDFFFGIRFGS